MFAYFALDGRWESAAAGAYTAISRPPCFSALMLWPQGNTWGGGGVFLDDCTFCGPGDFTLLPSSSNRLRAPEPEQGSGRQRLDRLRRDGWEGGGLLGDPNFPDARYWLKDAGGVLMLRKRLGVIRWTTRLGGVRHDDYALVNAEGKIAVDLPGAEWADFDAPRRRILFAGRGCVWQADISSGHLIERLLFDCSGMSFEPIPPPPEALQWP